MRTLVLGCGILLLGLPLAEAQSLPVYPSRADEAAQQQVSLSADAILVMLRRDPVLLLDVKRVLVKTAYDQGRLLDSDDLTDEALFRLIRKDENVRVLATQQIVRSQQRALQLRALAPSLPAPAQPRAAANPEGAAPPSAPPAVHKMQAGIPAESTESDSSPMLPISADQIPALLAQNPAAAQMALGSGGDGGEPGSDSGDLMAKLRSSLGAGATDLPPALPSPSADMSPTPAPLDVAVRAPAPRAERSAAGATRNPGS
jgi:hypothetical protein